MQLLGPLTHRHEHGVFLRREAIAAGLTDQALRRAVRAGDLVRVRHGAYVAADAWSALSAEGQHLVHLKAALLTHEERVAVSHFSAALLHGMDLWNAPLEKVHLTRLDTGAGRTSGDIVHHEGFWLPSDLVEVSGVTAVNPARAALEAALLLDVEAGLVVVDSGLRKKLFTRSELEEQLAWMKSWPAARRLQLVVRLADGRSGSVGESRSRHMFWAHNVPKPELQWEVYDENGDLVGIADFAWPEFGVFGEFDGRVKYERFLREGETPGDAVAREKKREDAMRRVTGYRFYRWTWSMLASPTITVAQLRAVLKNAA